MFDLCNGRQDDIVSEDEKERIRYQKEHELLQYYQLQHHNHYQTRDVQLNWNGKSYKIHTFIGGSDHQFTFVLLHGYGGSNVVFSKMYRQLIQRHRIFSIDLPGMGFSSKKGIQISNHENTNEFFVELIEQWRKKLNLEKFCLLGHSFGGYIATIYALKYPKFIEQLFLLSPAGTTQYTEIELTHNSDISNESIFRKLQLKFAREYWWDIQATPQQISQRWYGSTLVNKYLTEKLKFTGQEYFVWKNYTDELLSLPEGSEKALFYLFQFPKIMTKISIEFLIEKYELFKIFPIHFYYGDQDWMDKKGAENLNTKYPQRVSLSIIAKSGHQIILDQPFETINQLLADYQNYYSDSLNLQQYQTLNQEKNIQTKFEN